MAIESTSRPVCSGFLICPFWFLPLLVLCLFDVVRHESFCVLKTIVNVVVNFSILKIDVTECNAERRFFLQDRVGLAS